jgi:pimeloyl-ACP methyl ester carboxylesterase
MELRRTVVRADNSCAGILDWRKVMAFVLSTRAVRAAKFVAEPGPAVYLQVPDTELPQPSQIVEGKLWLRALRKAATWGRDARTGAARGDVLFFVHGYNNSAAQVMHRHRLLETGLRTLGFKGALVSFDWPSDSQTLNYLEDRHDAKKTAMQLVDSGIRMLAAEQEPNCTINIHVLAHSMGAFVVREAFDDADDVRLAQASWIISQLILVAGDISAGSMVEGNSSTDSLFRHCIRLTNYSSRFDFALKISNAKRIGMAPRVGRGGLPEHAPDKAVNVDCSGYFETLKSNESLRAAEQSEPIDDYGHAWYFANSRVMRDLFETLKGDLDRAELTTRLATGVRNRFSLSR